MLADIEVVVLAGGAGRRMGAGLPKPLTPVAGRPLLWHVVCMLRHAGFTRCTVALGHESMQIGGELGLPVHDVTAAGTHQAWPGGPPGLGLRLIDTGIDCDTGGRLGRLRHLLDGRFLLCWADGLTDLEFSAMLATHIECQARITLLAVQPEARFGELQLDGARVRRFVEKPAASQPWVHGGISIVEPDVLDLIEGPDCSWERDVLSVVAAGGQLAAHRHTGHWACADLPEDILRMERLAAAGVWPWLAGAA